MSRGVSASSMPGVSAKTGPDGLVEVVPDIVALFALFCLAMAIFFSSSGDLAWLVILF